jgi:hypothetical protein
LHRSLGKLIDVSVVDGAVLGGRIKLHRTAEACDDELSALDCNA